MDDKITRRQTAAMMFVGILSPAIRLLPGQTARLAGSAAYLGCVIAAVPTILYIIMYRELLRGDCGGLADALVSSAGRLLGGITAAALSVWLCVYAGFVLSAGSERLVSTVYPGGNAVMFILCTAAASAFLASGTLRALARTAQSFVLITALILGVTAVFAVPDIRPQNLVPDFSRGIGGALRAAVPVFDVMSIYVYFLIFAGHEEKRLGDGRLTVVRALASLGVISAILAVTAGVLSPVVCAALAHPFFAMTKNITFFDTVERIEAVIVALWVMVDIIYIGTLMRASAEAFCTAVPRFRARKTSIASAFVSAAAAIVFSMHGERLRYYSENLVPMVNIVLAVGVIPLEIVVGKTAKKLLKKIEKRC